MSQVREINCIDQLAEYRQAWAKLQSETPGASFFQSLDWLLCYWRHFGQGQRLRTLIVCEGSTFVGIVPLVVRRERTRVGNVAVLTYPLHDWASFYSPLGPDAGATLEAGLTHIASTRRDWDLLDLRWVDTQGSDRGQTPAALAAAGFANLSKPWDETALVDLADGWDAYWASRTSKFRNNVRRYERRLTERGEVRYVRYRPQGEAAGDCDPRWDLYQSCVDLARQSWQGSSDTGTTISHASISSFMSDVHEAAARSGSLDLNLLSIDERPVAFAYNYHYRGSVFGLRVGFDAQAARDGAGNLLYMRVLKDSCQRGDRLYDMGPGSLDIKQQILTRTAASFRYTHFAPLSPKAQLLRLKRTVERLRADATPAAPEAPPIDAPDVARPAGV